MEHINNKDEVNVDVLFDRVDKKIIEASAKRSLIINKLMSSLNELAIVPNNDKGSKLLEAQMSMLNTLDSLLKSDVNDVINQTKLNLSKKNSDSFDEVSKQSIALLKELRGIENMAKSESFESNIDGVDEILDNIETKEITPDELKMND